MSKKQERLSSLKNQAERVQRRMDALARRGRRFWQFKLAIIFLGFMITIIALSKISWLAIPVVCATIVIFYCVSSLHLKVNESFIKYKTLLQIKNAQIARIQLDWEHIPPTQSSDVEADHPFNRDLDVTGEHSLHRLMNTGVSLEGRWRLSEWLLSRTPDIEVIHERQTLIQELVPLTLFRDKLQLNSLFATRYMPDPLEGEKLLLWLEAQSEIHRSPLTVIFPTILSVFTFLLLLLFIVGYIPVALCFIPLLLALGWHLWTRRHRGMLSADASYLRTAFGQLRIIFEFLEKYPYGKHLQLKRLCEPFFMNPDNRPSALLHGLSRLAKAALVENAELFGLLVNAFIPWDAYVAYFLAQYCKRIAKLFPIWLETWYELEALSSIANFAYLNPDYIVPTLVVNKALSASPCFQTQGLGHPLIEDEKKVLNDFTLGSSQEIMLITGSNMAGKSTFLRTIGINLILAYVGGPVNAVSLRTSLFEISACIRVTDSVTDGYSYFYAEVRRLKGLLTRLQEGAEYPMFFFIDEIFRGTNNRERLIGSISYIQALVDQNCVGAISTHDLDLVRLSDRLPQIAHYHFREEIIDGQMVFDYKLREGPSPTTNALKIMQLEGLPIISPDYWPKETDNNIDESLLSGFLNS